MLSTLLPPHRLARPRRSSKRSHSHPRTMALRQSSRRQEQPPPGASPSVGDDAAAPHVSATRPTPPFDGIAAGPSQSPAARGRTRSTEALQPFPVQSGASTVRMDQPNLNWQQQEMRRSSPLMPPSVSTPNMTWQQQQLLHAQPREPSPPKKYRARKPSMPSHAKPHERRRHRSESIDDSRHASHQHLSHIKSAGGNLRGRAVSSSGENWRTPRQSLPAFLPSDAGPSTTDSSSHFAGPRFLNSSPAANALPVPRPRRRTGHSLVNSGRPAQDLSSPPALRLAAARTDFDSPGPVASSSGQLFGAWQDQAQSLQPQHLQHSGVPGATPNTAEVMMGLQQPAPLPPAGVPHTHHDGGSTSPSAGPSDEHPQPAPNPADTVATLLGRFGMN